jgi:hypothetical protein
LNRNIPPSKSKQSKYHDLRQEIKEEVPPRFIDWEDLSDEEQQEILEREYQYQLNIDSRMSAPALPPPIPTTAELAVMLAQTMHAVGQITTQVQDLATEVANLAATHTCSGATSKDTVARPKAWDGKSGSAEARHFLAAFHNWAFGQGDSLNTWIPAANHHQHHDGKWIQAVLNLMEGDARTWALPHLEIIKTGAIPFNTDWTHFEREFTKQFIPLDIAEAARDALKRIRQGNKSVAEYISKLDQYTMQTVTICLGLIVLRKRSIQTIIGTVFIHTVILPSCLLPRCCHVMCPVMCRSCVVLCSSSSFHELLILVLVY